MRVERLVAVLVVASGAAAALADQVLAYGQRYGGAGAGQYVSNLGNIAGDSFTLGAAADISAAEFWVYDVFGVQNDLTLSIWETDQSGTIQDGNSGSDAIYEETFSPGDLTMQGDGANVLKVSATFASGISLDGGTEYYFAVRWNQSDFLWMVPNGGPDAPTDGLFAAGFDSDAGSGDTFFGYYSGGTGNDLAFGLYTEASVVPLPTASALAGLGLCVVCGRRQRQRM